jgi:DNA-directed RNA polymerase subunit RPC12/RpoP
MRVQYTLLLYHNLLPSNETTLLRCMSCGRPLFKTTSKTIEITNATGVGIERGQIYTENICGSCNTVYKVLYQ